MNVSSLFISRISGPLSAKNLQVSYLKAIHCLFKNTVGIEIQMKFLENCRGIDVIRAPGETIPLKSGCCQLVRLVEVIEHVKMDDVVLKEIYRILCPNGFLFPTAPNRLHPFETHRFHIKGRLLEISLRLALHSYRYCPSS